MALPCWAHQSGPGTCNKAAYLARNAHGVLQACFGGYGRVSVPPLTGQSPLGGRVRSAFPQIGHGAEMRGGKTGLSSKDLRPTPGGQQPVADSQPFAERNLDAGVASHRASLFAQGDLRRPRAAIIRDVRICRKVMPMSDATQILYAIEQGDHRAAERLLPLVYDELRKLAAQKMAQEKPGQTLQATALVHEAYLRLVDVDKVQRWNSRGHFFAAAAEAMRRILVEKARRKRTEKAGGGRQRVSLSWANPETDRPRLDLLALNDALAKLEAKDARKAKLVKLRFFAGFTNRQAAQALGVATSTVDADWAYAKSWLRVEMADPRRQRASLHVIRPHYDR